MAVSVPDRLANNLAEEAKIKLLAAIDLSDDGVRGVPLPTLLEHQAQLFVDAGSAARLDPKGTYAKSRQARNSEVIQRT